MKDMISRELIISFFFFDPYELLLIVSVGIYAYAFLTSDRQLS